MVYRCTASSESRIATVLRSRSQEILIYRCTASSESRIATRKSFLWLATFYRCTASSESRIATVSIGFLMAFTAQIGAPLPVKVGLRPPDDESDEGIVIESVHRFQ